MIAVRFKKCVIKSLIIFYEHYNLLLIGLLQVKWLKNLIALYADDNILYFNEDSGNALFSCNTMSIVGIDFNNIKLDNTNYEDDSETIIHIRHLAWYIKSEKSKALKKEWNKELMLIVWHPTRWLNFCLSEDEKK